MAKTATETTKKAERAVMVTTAHRGVFFGYATETDGEIVTLRKARMCLYWPATQRGVLGLATMGPQQGARISPAVDSFEVRAITGVIACTDEAAQAWERAPWS